MHGPQGVPATIPHFQSKQLPANANFLSARLLSGESHELDFSDMDVSGPSSLQKFQILQQRLLRTSGNAPSATKIPELHHSHKITTMGEFVDKSSERGRTCMKP
jgi:hypothetical protein